MDKMNEARRAGMEYALRIAKEKGIDGLEQEIKFRNITKCPITIPQQKYIEFATKVREDTIKVATILIASTLRDEFDFGHDRIMRAIKRFNSKAGCIADGYVEMDEVIQSIAEEIGIDLRA